MGRRASSSHVGRVRTRRDRVYAMSPLELFGRLQIVSVNPGSQSRRGGHGADGTAALVHRSRLPRWMRVDIPATKCDPPASTLGNPRALVFSAASIVSQ
jgi:hypothetical protein